MWYSSQHLHSHPSHTCCSPVQQEENLIQQPKHTQVLLANFTSGHFSLDYIVFTSASQTTGTRAHLHHFYLWSSNTDPEFQLPFTVLQLCSSGKLPEWSQQHSFLMSADKLHCHEYSELNPENAQANTQQSIWNLHFWRWWTVRGVHSALWKLPSGLKHF